jgi:hypothetical protein
MNERQKKFYIDLDDCLCETARHFSVFADDLFGKRIPYEEIRYFNLKKAFSLTDDQYEHMMIEAHKPDVLLAYEETPDASAVINAWVDEGHDVSVITGRPFSAYEASREWLDQHGFGRVKLYCLDKYGRDNFIRNSEFSLEIEDYMKMHFDYAIEDSPSAFKFFDHLPQLRIMVFDRPWNRDCDFPSERYSRCCDWKTIKSLVDKEI